MRRKMALGTISLLVLLGAAIVGWAQQGGPQPPDPGQGQHRFMGGGECQWGGGPGAPHRFAEGGPGQFGGRGWEGMRGGHRMMGWQRGGMHRFGGGFGLLRLADSPRARQYLALTDDQVTRLHKVGIDAEKASVQNRADMELRRIELHELMRADNPDHDAIMQKLDEVNAQQGKMAKQRVEAMLSARSVLTPDQIKKVKTFMENRGGPESGPEHGQMMRRGGPDRPPGRPGAPGGPAPAPKPPTPPTQ